MYAKDLSDDKSPLVHIRACFQEAKYISYLMKYANSLVLHKTNQNVGCVKAS